MGVFDDLAQLIEDQSGLKFQRGCQGMRNGKQGRLFAHLVLYLPAQDLFCLDPLAYVSYDT